MNKDTLAIIMVTIFCSIGFWFLVTSSLLIFVKTLIKILISYKIVDAFGRLSTIDFEENWFEIILANNQIMRIYSTKIKPREKEFIFCQVKYNLLKLRWEYNGLFMVITRKNMNESIKGYFGDYK